LIPHVALLDAPVGPNLLEHLPPKVTVDVIKASEINDFSQGDHPGRMSSAARFAGARPRPKHHHDAPWNKPY
jgi:hypothetical protein